MALCFADVVAYMSHCKVLGIVLDVTLLSTPLHLDPLIHCSTKVMYFMRFDDTARSIEYELIG